MRFNSTSTTWLYHQNFFRDDFGVCGGHVVCDFDTRDHALLWSLRTTSQFLFPYNGNVSLNSFRVSFHFCTFMYLWWSNSSIILYDPFETCWVQLILRTVSWKLTTLCYTPSRKTCTHIGSNLQTLRPVETLCWVCAIVCVWFVYLLCAQVRDRRRECSCLSVYVCWSFCCK